MPTMVKEAAANTKNRPTMLTFQTKYSTVYKYLPENHLCIEATSQVAKATPVGYSEQKLAGLISSTRHFGQIQGTWSNIQMCIRKHKI